MSQIRVSRLSRLLCLLIFRAAAGHSAPTLFMIGGASSVSIFDRATLTEQGFVAAPNFTQSVALSSDGTQAYIATGGGIRVVNAITHLLAGRLPSSNAAIVRLSPDGTRLYAANVNGSVWVYDTASGTVTQRIPFLVKDASFYGVADLTVSADGTLVALGSVESMCGEFGCPPGDPPALITEINGQSGTLIKRLPTAYVSSLAISGDDSSVYVAEGSVIVQVNAANGQTTATIPFAANRIALDSVAGRLYAGTANSPYTLGVFSPSDDSSVGSVTLTGPVAALAFSPDHSTIFAGGCVVNEGDDPFPCPVAAISAGTLQASTSGTLTGSPADFAVSAGSNRLWVANGSGVELTAVNTGNNLVSGEAEISYSPFTMAVTPSGNKVYTANLDGTVSVINGYNLSRKKVLNVSATPFNLLGDDCVSPDGKRAYVALDHLQVIDTSSDQIVGTITELPFGCVVSRFEHGLHIQRQLRRDLEYVPALGHQLRREHFDSTANAELSLRTAAIGTLCGARWRRFISRYAVYRLRVFHAHVGSGTHVRAQPLHKRRSLSGRKHFVLSGSTRRYVSARCGRGDRDDYRNR